MSWHMTDPHPFDMQKSTYIARCVVASLLFANLATAVICPLEYVALGGGCFKFLQEVKSFPAAEDFCEAEGSTLADVANDGQMTSLLDYVNAMFPGTFWTSGQFKNEKFQWSNTEQQVPQSWRGRRFRKANNMCIYICSRTNKIWDSRCSTPKRFICKSNTPLDVDSIEAF
ncbi:C-type lectin-like [Trinorchestia longiramus]|nr:C-type lectin-like [Trinorchestia longiramus]